MEAKLNRTQPEWDTSFELPSRESLGLEPDEVVALSIHRNGKFQRLMDKERVDQHNALQERLTVLRSRKGSRRSEIMKTITI